MSRNSSGTYTLPTGNPVVAGTTIDATWANTTLSDIATELTNSLARTGTGGMTGALRLANGTSTVPGLAWGDETGTGFYRAGTSDTRFVTQTALIQQWTATGTAVTGTFSVTGNTTLGDAAGDTLTITGTAGTTPNGLNIDSDTLVVDAVNDRVGIGTSSPGAKLDVSGAFGTGTTGVTLSNSSAFSASNIARFDFRVANSFGGLERVAAVWALNPNAAANNGGALVFGTSANGTATTPTEHMRLDSSGNLGIGTSSPAGKVDAVSNAYAAFTARASTSGAGQTVDALKAVDSGAANFANARYSATAHIWNYAGVTEGMRLDASGNLGIGTSSPARKLEVNGAIRLANASSVEWGGTSAYVAGESSTNTLFFGTSSTERARITSGGDLLVGTTANPGVFNRSVVIDSGANALAGVVFQNDTTGRGSTDGSHIGISSSDFVIVNLENAPIRLRTNNVERMVVKGPGQVRFVPLASAPGGAEAGDVYYDSGTNKLRCYNGTTWNDLF